MNQGFIPGLDLAERFYAEAVRPILAEHFPDLAHSAALLGEGSDVLAYDTPQSTDHDWGPRLMLFLAEADHEAHRNAFDRMLRRKLPAEIHGYPTGFGRHDDGTTVMQTAGEGSIDHCVRILTVDSFFRDILGFSPTGRIRAADWVRVPQNRLLMLTAGRVFHDGLGRLAPLRAKLAYYPHDVWLYLLAAQWRRIAQEEAFLGRCGQVGDDLGSRLIATRLARDLMRLCFLMERRYAPYLKWFGSAFARLDCAAELLPTFSEVLGADSWQARQAHLSAAYEFVARKHNDLGLTPPLAPQVSPYYDRPFLVIHADRFVDALRAEIRSEEVLALPEHLGSVDQFLDSTDVLNFLDRLDALYG